MFPRAARASVLCYKEVTECLQIHHTLTSLPFRPSKIPVQHRYQIDRRCWHTMRSRGLEIHASSDYLQMVRWRITSDRLIDGTHSISKLSRKWASFKRIQRLVQLLQLRDPKDHAVAILPVQHAMECRPADRSCVAINPMLRSSGFDSGH